jgi:uncharacterized protein
MTVSGLELTPAFVVAALVATIVLGLAKGGFTGMGALATPILALAISPVQAAAIILPILLVQDVISVWAFRKSWNRAIVGWMLPGAIIGVAIGWGLAALVPVTAVMTLVGGISVLFGTWRLWLARGGRVPLPAKWPDWIGSLFGIATGFTSQVAHAGGPPFQMWVQPKRLPPLEFAGTNSLLFAMINWIKVPAYLALGELTPVNLKLSALLLPVAVLATLSGVWLVRRITLKHFYTIVNLLMILLGFKLMVDGLF